MVNENNNTKFNSPKMTAILAISLDGKIASATETPARFSSQADLRHLEQQIALCDGIIFGASTLRAYGTTMIIKDPQLLEQREQRKQSPQPLNIVCSSSGNLDVNCPFFSQPVKRVLLTTKKGSIFWQSIKDNLSVNQSGFEKIIISENADQESINWINALLEFQRLNLRKIGVLGGAKLLSSLLLENLIDDFWLTLCPIIFASNKATDLINFYLPCPLKLNLLESKIINSEVFLHYQIINSDDP
jgi:riboflavin biosynthesis pyrimidine reductase